MEQGGLFDAPPPAKPAAKAPRPKAPALELVPYGKYKDQPLGVLLVDDEYAIWLMQARQAHLRRHHPQLLQWLHKQFGPPASTPEQNRLQNRFLQPEFCVQLLLRVQPGLAQRLAAAVSEAALLDAWRARLPSRIALRYEDYRPAERFGAEDEVPESHQRHRQRVLQALEREIPRLVFDTPEALPGTVPVVAVEGMPAAGRAWEPVLQLTQAVFEEAGAQVQFRARARLRVRVDGGPRELAAGPEAPATLEDDGDVLAEVAFEDEVRVELRAQLGDDYPSVLRRMRAQRCNVLLVHRFEADGACWEELNEVFARRGIRVALLDEVLMTPVPPALRRLPLPSFGPEALQAAAREALDAFDAQWLQQGRRLQQRPG